MGSSSSVSSLIINTDGTGSSYNSSYNNTNIFNVLNYGADPTGTNLSTSAIKGAISDAKNAKGGTILFPVPGTYKFNSQLVLDGTVLINLEGPSTGNASQPGDNSTGYAANLVYTGSTDPSAISLRSAKGITFKNLGILWNSSAFTGYLVDCRKSSSPSSAETTNIVFEDCTLAGFSSSLYPNCGALLFLDGCYSIQCVRTSFFGGNYNVIGIDVGGQKYSSTVLFNGCYFEFAATCAVQLPNQAWKFVSCTFEPTQGTTPGTTGPAGAITCYDNGTAYPGSGVDIDACWFGDDGGVGTWINWYGYGLRVHNCEIGVNGLTTFINISTNGCYGISVENNVFAGGGGESTVINFGNTVGHSGLVCRGNSYYNYQPANNIYYSIANIISGIIPTGSVIEYYSGPIIDSPTITTGIYGDNLELQSAISPNLLSSIQADFETIGFPIGWVADQSCSIATTTAAAKHGTRCLAVTFVPPSPPPSPPNPLAYMQMAVNSLGPPPPPPSPLKYSGLVAVKPFTAYTALASFLCAPGSTPRMISIDIYGYDSNQNPLSPNRIATTNAFPQILDGTPASSSSSSSSTSGAANWTQLSVTAITPWNCAYIGLFIRWTGSENLTPGEVHYLDTVQIAQGYSLIWEPPGTVPVTIVAGPGAGTSPTVSINGNTNAGNIKITTGSSPTANAVVATVNFTTPYSAAPKVIILTSVNGNAAASGVWADSAAWTAYSFTLNVGSTALSPSTTYEFGYLIFG